MNSDPIRPPVLVFGVGNTLLRDDAVGLIVLSELERHQDKWGPDVEFLDGGTQGLALLDWLAGRDALLILDAVKLGAEPGTVHVLQKWDRAAVRASTAHESNVAELLEASALLGELPELVTIVGIEPQRVETGIGLSPAVRGAVSRAVEAATAAITEMVGRALRR